eukprot:s633_g6.t1
MSDVELECPCECEGRTQELRTSYALGGLGFVVLVVLALFSLQAVPNLHYGIRYNTAGKWADVDNVYTAGRYLIGPWNTFVLFPSVVQNVEFSNTFGLAASGHRYPALHTRTKEGLALNLEVSLQYRLKQEQVGKLYTEFNVDFQNFFVSTIRESVIKVAADYEAYQLWDQRKEVGNQMQREVNAVLNRTYAECWGLQLLDIALPKAFDQSIVQTQVQNQAISTEKFAQTVFKHSIAIKIGQFDDVECFSKSKGHWTGPATWRGMSESPASVACERSHWGLFDREVKTVRTVDDQQQAVAYRSLSYHCAGKTVEFYQPLEGAGTRLMHGGFGRKISPSEEALATYILKRPRLFHGRRVLVVGAGLGLAGLVCGSCTKAQEVLLTDGDPEVVKLLEKSLQLNRNSGDDSPVVHVQQLLWDRTEHWPERASYDVILGADVVYLEDLHLPLLDMMARVLAPGGHGLIFASKRNCSLENFVASSKSVFGAVEVSMDYDMEVEKAIGRASKCFPVFVKISIPSQAEDSAAVQRICQRFAELREQQQQEASDAKQRQQRLLLRRRAKSEELLLRREQRLQRAAEAVEIEPEPVEAPAVRVPLVPRAELEGRSDWGIFARSLQVIGEVKEMTYHCGKCQVRLRRHPSSPRISCAEEALAAWVLKSRTVRRGRILELGAGTGLAGLVAARLSRKHVELSDGDPSSVEALEEAVALNGGVSLGARQLKFGEVPAMKKFDLIIAAEILEKDSHAAILRTARKLLKSSGSFVIMASGGLETFLREAAGVFPKIQLRREYDDAVSKALRGMPCRPKLAILRRPQQKRRPVAVPREVQVQVPLEKEEVAENESRHSQESEAEEEGDEGQEDLAEAGERMAKGSRLKHSQSDPSCQLSAMLAPREGRSEGTIPKGPDSDARSHRSAYPDGRGSQPPPALVANRQSVARPLIRRVKSLPFQGKFLALPSQL